MSLLGTTMDLHIFVYINISVGVGVLKIIAHPLLKEPVLSALGFFYITSIILTCIHPYSCSPIYVFTVLCNHVNACLEWRKPLF